MTLVPGSQGPRQSGSVTVPTLVQVDIDFISGDPEDGEDDDEDKGKEDASVYKGKITIKKCFKVIAN